MYKKSQIPTLETKLNIQLFIKTNVYTKVKPKPHIRPLFVILTHLKLKCSLYAKLRRHITINVCVVCVYVVLNNNLTECQSQIVLEVTDVSD